MSNEPIATKAMKRRRTPIWELAPYHELKRKLTLRNYSAALRSIIAIANALEAQLQNLVISRFAPRHPNLEA